MSDSKDNFLSVIEVLRFPLIVLVVMIHAHITTMAMGENVWVFDSAHFPVYNTVSTFFSEILARIAVPMFFFFSGYLFFRNAPQVFSSAFFISKLKSRAKSLLVPYIIWNLLVLVLFFVLQTWFSSFASGYSKLIKDYTLTDYFRVFWCTEENHFPICFQLWYIRDLMVVCVFAPVIWWLIHRTGIVSVLLLTILWVSGVWPYIPGISDTAFAFFSAGALFAVKDISVVCFCRKLRFVALPAALVLTLVLLWKESCFDMKLLLNLDIISMMIYVCAAVSSSVHKSVRPGSTLLSRSSFFIFAYHVLPMIFLTKIMLKFIQPTAEISILAVYFAAPMAVVLLGIFLYWVLSRIFPRTTYLITGRPA